MDFSCFDAPSRLTLSAGEIHLWNVSLEVSQDAIGRLDAMLSADERQRASRFRAGSLRRRFVVGRGSLRSILAAYLHHDPTHLEFHYNRWGKPSLPPRWQESGIRFNMAHSQDLALVAVAAGQDVGVDVEWIRPVANLERLVERYFASREKEQWRGLARGEQLTGFFQGWTCKEAWLKAVGAGLSYPLDQVCTSLRPDAPAKLLSIEGDDAAARPWWIESFVPAPGFIAAVVVRGGPAEIRRFTIQPPAE
jgi:4'-phosphopantetheinyl transferase